MNADKDANDQGDRLTKTAEALFGQAIFATSIAAARTEAAILSHDKERIAEALKATDAACAAQQAALQAIRALERPTDIEH